ncbi:MULTISPECIES: DegT/DnrJ/EryC1/StrS family aminotransferase [unclassified Guyparkeria]|uniref:DegT/DnrJ/EryC1/StrS family aminotransferase n=1 Tax=unclassified Guyparkeria TaxID=2626246 RepID=UPI0007338EAB|nr:MULTISPECIES: DegT/DnrJ/EryC1/StrS family aminotransferase [unclassified Guyparkeria]KTG17123.1 aminotransferase [Guyparkeria sp. XI15]OAE86658.1 aminotransferase [Guyparkeria sp. WRN-7]
MTTPSDKSDDPIFVTQPHLPPLEEVIPYLEQIWDSHRITNKGPFHEQLEVALCDYLGVQHISLFANGTLALVTAMQALRLTGEVITTPYSFVATANALLWNDLTPVFVDVDPVTLNLDPAQVEAAITPKTSAILPVHVYGQPADVDGLQHVADLYGLRLIYDAAHCFGVEDEGGSILRHGDMSILSFHATKVFNTFEGGAIVSPDAKTKQRVDYLKNFGFANETTVVAAGINAKMNEFQAAIGLAQLHHIDDAIIRRAQLDQTYREALADVKGIRCPPVSRAARYNYAYFPIFVEEGYPLSRDDLYLQLQAHGVYGRRYFYPLIPEFPMYRNLPSNKRDQWKNANKASKQVICLPLSPNMSEEMTKRATRIITANGTGN